MKNKSVKIYKAGEVAVEDIIINCLNCGQKMFVQNGKTISNCPKCGLNLFTN